MLKRFFISLLGTVAGLWISLVLVIAAGFLFVIAIIGKNGGDSAVKLQDKSILYFDLSGDIQERYTSRPFFEMIQSFDSGSLTLEDMLKSLKAAADDDKIEALYIYCGGSSLGFASREELIEGISEFKKSGKPIVAYSDSYAQADYLVATTADSLYLNPFGSVDIHGVGGQTPFFKGLLDKLGVKMQIIKVGTFKSAVEPYILTSMSEPARLQMQQYCDTIWQYEAETMAANRSLSVDTIKSMASQMIFTRQAPSFVESGLVDALKYKRTIEDYLLSLSGLDEDDDVRLITPSDYLSARSELSFSSLDEHIAVYYCVGDIVDSGQGGISGEVVPGDIVELADDDNVKGLILRVNSGGGSAFASEQIWEALEYFKSKDKPFYVSMGDYAASGGYYISCGADSIFADRTTITGSIGVFGMIPDLSGLITDKLGVNFSTVETNPNATGITGLKAMTPAQYAAMQHSVENVYDTFTKRVAEGRHMSQDSVKAIAEGRVWIGSRALQLGLVDRLGSLDTTIKAMADNLGIDSDKYVSYPLGEEKMWEKLLRESGNFGMKTEMPFDAETARYLYFVKQLREMNPVQARMETVEVK